jgi:hypothetical protein
MNEAIIQTQTNGSKGSITKVIIGSNFGGGVMNETEDMI